MARRRKICVVGSGSWATVIAKIVAYNANKYEHLHDNVYMCVYDEMFGDSYLSEIINKTHENVKYLVGIPLPLNVVAITDLVEATKQADILIFAMKYQNIGYICRELEGQIKPTAAAISLIKGLDVCDDGSIDLISRRIYKHLKIHVSVLMGANISRWVAQEEECETTIGCRDKRMSPIYRDVFQTKYFRISNCDDVEAVEAYGAMQNIVGIAVGLSDGLDLGRNTKQVVIKYGLVEMLKFVNEFYPGSRLITIFHSCGVGSLITTCYSGIEYFVANAYAKQITQEKNIDQIAEEMFPGNALQGPITAEEVYIKVKERKIEIEFPLSITVHKICTGKLPVEAIKKCIIDNPPRKLVLKGTIF